ncbi:MAG: tetratricopeptide repeat protein [Nanoarchaeota archaeon]
MDKELTVEQALKLAVKKHNEGRINEAEIIYREILNKNPNNSEALHLLGLIAHQTGDSANAINLINKAIKSNPNIAIYYNNLGMIYDTLKKEEESTKNFNEALEVDPNHLNAHLAHYNLGVSLMNNGKILEALEHYDKAVKLNKNFFDASWNKSLILLLLGRFKEGWIDYESRFKKKNPSDSRNFNNPKWNGSDLKEKKILIVSEQGFGDNIQFIRYIPLIKEKGAYIILECKKELIDLFSQIKEIDEIIERGNNQIENVKIDYYIHLMSLPKIFNTNLGNIPNNTPYLKADFKLVEKFKPKFKTNKFNIGIVWAGNPLQDNDKNRSTTFEKFKSLKIPDVVFFSLQKGDASKQLNDPEIIDIADEINDFNDTAAVIENLDLIISVDTSVAHLAGAMAKPTWTLLSFIPDWRWLIDRTDSPWYPSMKLFRQKKLGDWDSLFNEVSKELKKISRKF